MSCILVFEEREIWCQTLAHGKNYPNQKKLLKKHTNTNTNTKKTKKTIWFAWKTVKTFYQPVGMKIQVGWTSRLVVFIGRPKNLGQLD